MHESRVAEGIIVRVKDDLASTNGMVVADKFLTTRRTGTMGKVIQYTADPLLIFVRHGKTVAAYWPYEVDLIGVPRK